MCRPALRVWMVAVEVPAERRWIRRLRFRSGTLWLRCPVCSWAPRWVAGEELA